MKFDFTADDRGWNLPDGTIAVKSFALDSAAGRRWIETRLLVKQDGEWAGYSYAWNDEQTEATLVPSTGLDHKYDVPRADGKLHQQTWHYPGRTECMVCHSRAANFVLGLSAWQFNKTHEYGGKPVNQLEALERLGVLRVIWIGEQHAAIRAELKKSGKGDKVVDAEFEHLTASRGQREPKVSSLLFQRPAKYPKLADPYDVKEDLTVRVKSYLHSNCAQCHVEAGGGNAQMNLAWSTPLAEMKIVDAAPLHHTFGRSEARIIAPGDPSQSVLLHRMSIRDQGQMPQLATNVVDEQAVQLIREWIESLAAEPASVSAGKDGPAP